VSGGSRQRFRRARRATFAGSVVIASAVLVAVAVAREDLGSAGGVDYRQANRFFDPPDTPKATATCPSSRHVAGGTFAIYDPESTDTFIVNGSLPVDLGDGDHQPDDGWRVKGSYIPAHAGAATTAMCTEEDYRYRVKHQPVAVGYPPEVRVGCGGDNWHVTGGGASIPTGNNLTESFPFDSDDSRGRPDDGWAATAYVDNLDVRLSVYAVCAHEAPEYHKESRVLNPGSGSSVLPDCAPDSHLIGAGGKVHGSSEYSTIKDVLATDDPGEPGQAPDDGAYALGNLSLASPASQRLTGYAICAK
jgi:hypothetical protein